MVKATYSSAAVLAIALTFCAGRAGAEEQFDVTADGGKILLATKGAWHVNVDYPWKAVFTGQTFDKSKFVFTEKSATLSGVPHGTAQIKGAVCNGPQCMPFTKQVTVQ